MRNLIHHPENKKINLLEQTDYEDKLKESIDILIDLITKKITKPVI
jgi:hypothetical protein